MNFYLWFFVSGSLFHSSFRAGWADVYKSEVDERFDLAELRKREEMNQRQKEDFEQRQRQWDEHRRQEEDRQRRIESELSLKFRQQEEELRRRQEENRQFMQVRSSSPGATPIGWSRNGILRLSTPT